MPANEAADGLDHVAALADKVRPILTRARPPPNRAAEFLCCSLRCREREPYG